MTGVPRERNHLANVFHTSNEHEKSLETQTETAVGDSSVTTKIAVPPVVGLVETAGCDELVENVEALFTLGSADNLADERGKKIHACASLAILVQAHVESLDLGRVVSNEGGALENLFGDVSLMFSLQVLTPCNWEFELNLETQI